MGCDIHGVIERRVGEKWIAVEVLTMIHCVRGGEDLDNFAVPAALERNYKRCAKLAGVRGDGPEARGLPDDATDTARYIFDTEGHTPSWLPLSEAAAIFAATEHNKVGDWAKEYPSDFYFNVGTEEIDKYRFVFWFDS